MLDNFNLLSHGVQRKTADEENVLQFCAILLYIINDAINILLKNQFKSNGLKFNSDSSMQAEED